MTVSVTAVLLATGAQVSFALPDPTAATAPTAPTTTTGTASGTTGPQTCPTPPLKGLPKTPKFTNATIHFKLTNVTPGSAYIVRAGDREVLGGTAVASTEKNKFLLPDQGTHDGKVVITAIVDIENCENAPWKLQKKIHYNAVTAPAAAPAAPAAGTPAAGTPVAAREGADAKADQAGKASEAHHSAASEHGTLPQRRAWRLPSTAVRGSTRSCRRRSSAVWTKRRTRPTAPTR